MDVGFLYIDFIDVGFGDCDCFVNDVYDVVGSLVNDVCLDVYFAWVFGVVAEYLDLCGLK